MRRGRWGGEEVALVVGLALVGGLGGLLVLAGALDGLIFGSGPAWAGRGGLAATLGRLLMHPGNPAAAYAGARAHLAHAWEAYWGSLVLVVVLVLGAVLLVRWVVIAAWRHQPGRAQPRRARTARTSPWASTKVIANGLSAEAAIARDRSDGSVAPWRIGTARGLPVHVAYEDSVLIMAPPRAGKTSSLGIPQILDAPGPVVALGTRADFMVATAASRGRMGRLWVWDPQHLGPSVGSEVRWPLSTGCELPETARVRAGALAFGSARGVENATYWTERTSTVLEALLHAAALDRHNVGKLRRWAASPPAAREAVSILRERHGADGWDDALDAVISSDARHRDSVWSGVAEAIKPVGLPSVAELVTYDEAAGFDVEEFLAGPNTLYMIGTASGALGARPVMAALLDDIAEHGRRRASASRTGRLAPPLSLVLDELAKLCPFPSLPALLADGGGSGIATSVVIQSLSQLETGWSRAEQVEMWTNASCKLILGGTADPDYLRTVSDLIGSYEVEERSRTSAERGRESVQVSARQENIASPDMIRELPIGEAIMLYRHLPPVRLRLTKWDDRPGGAELRQHEARLRREMVADRG